MAPCVSRTKSYKGQMVTELQVEALPENRRTVHTPCISLHHHWSAWAHQVPPYGCSVQQFLLLSLYFKHFAHRELLLCIMGSVVRAKPLPEDAPLFLRLCPSLSHYPGLHSRVWGDPLCTRRPHKVPLEVWSHPPLLILTPPDLSRVGSAFLAGSE